MLFPLAQIFSILGQTAAQASLSTLLKSFLNRIPAFLRNFEFLVSLHISSRWCLMMNWWIPLTTTSFFSALQSMNAVNHCVDGGGPLWCNLWEDADDFLTNLVVFFFLNSLYLEVPVLFISFKFRSPFFLISFLSLRSCGISLSTSFSRILHSLMSAMLISARKNPTAT